MTQEFMLTLWQTALTIIFGILGWLGVTVLSGMIDSVKDLKSEIGEIRNDLTVLKTEHQLMSKKRCS